MILETYSDDSETDELYIVAGYVASMDDWKSFTPQWHDRLKQPPRLGYYRTSDALALKSQFAHFDESSRNQRIVALSRVIPNGRNCFGVASWVSKQDFVKYCEPVFHPAWHDPYYLCATYLILRLCRDLNAMNLEKIDFFFDRQGKVGTQYKYVYDAFLKPVSMSLFPFMGDVRHEDKRDFLPLQAGDMQAGWVRRSKSTNQLRTSADDHLSQIAQKHYPIQRPFLEYIDRYGHEHSGEISAFWADYMKATNG